MSAEKHAVIAYLATLSAIVLLAIAAAMICVLCPAATPLDIARIIGALSFVSAAVTGLIGVIGTFRPKGPPLASTEKGDVNLGAGA